MTPYHRGIRYHSDTLPGARKALVYAAWRRVAPLRRVKSKLSGPIFAAADAFGRKSKLLASSCCCRHLLPTITPSMRALILILGAVLGMSEKRVQFKLAATVAYESVPSRAEALGEAAGLSQVKRVFRHAPKHEAKHRAQGLHLWYTGAAATAADADRAVAQLQADPDVASAELDQEVQML